jgi:uncharacterized protein YceK
MNQLIKLCTILIGFVVLSGCGTIYTTTFEPEIIQRESCSNNCTIPRIYSGTAADLCLVLAPEGGQGSAIMFFDLFLSIPLDTVILPYTIYGQITEGNLAEKGQCKVKDITSNKSLKQDK